MKKHNDIVKTPTDEQIIEMYWLREERAIDETDKKYGQLLYRIAYNILHDRLDCEECQNDTYLDVWNAIPPTKPTVFSSFIIQIIRRIAIDRYKSKTSQKRIPSELTISIDDLRETLYSDESDEFEMLTQDIGRNINNYVRGLPKRQKYIFIDRFYFGESVKSIAQTLSISVPTVYREIDKIKDGLRLFLERNEIHI